MSEFDDTLVEASAEKAARRSHLASTIAAVVFYAVVVCLLVGGSYKLGYHMATSSHTYWVGSLVSHDGCYVIRGGTVEELAQCPKQ